MISICAAAMLLLAQEKAQEVQVTRVSVHRTPKGVKVIDAGSPAIKIEIGVADKKAGEAEKYEIRLTINRADGKAKAPVTVTMGLSKEAWDEALKLIADKKLAEWKPQDEKPADAFGVTGFEIEGKPANAQTWKGPAKNLDAPNALIAWMNKKATAAFKNSRIDWR